MEDGGGGYLPGDPTPGQDFPPEDEAKASSAAILAVY